MKPAVAPTSPKNKPSAPVAEVWQHGPIQQPNRLPWGRIFFLILVISFIVGVGLTVGAVWFQRYGPTGWWTRWLPVATTTVVQQTTVRQTNDVPKAVRQFADSLVGLSVRHDQDVAYGQEDIVGLTVPLSDNGWMLTLHRPPAADQPPLVTLPVHDQIQEITAWLADPSSPLVFAKIASSNESPATFGDIADSLDQPVWVIRRTIRDHEIFPRRIVGSLVPAWPSSDRIERTYQLDAPVSAETGAAAVNAAGQLIGLLSADGHVWPVRSVQPLLKNLVQQGLIERTSLGIRARRQDELVIASLPTASGWLIGAGTDQTAVDDDSAGARAGLKTGDSILAIDGKSVQGDLFDALQRWQPGETAQLTVQRNGVERELTVQFSALHP